MSAVLSRNSYNEVEFLSANLCVVSRKPGALILPNNFGSFSPESNQLVIPAVNVGTVLKFVRPITGWKYLQITLSGMVQKVSFMNAAGMVVASVDPASAGTDIGTVTLTVPFCGPIQSIAFDNPGLCLVSSIKAVFDIVYNLERNDPEQLRIVGDVNGDPAEFAEDDETGARSYIVPPLGIFTAHFAGTLEEGYQGRCKVEIFSDTGSLVSTQVFTFFDGQLIYSMKNLSPAIVIFPVPGPINDAAFVRYTNDYAWTMTVRMTPVVSYFMPLSTTYGAPVTLPVDDTQNFLILPHTDDFNGAQKLIQNHTSPTGAQYTMWDGDLETGLKIDGLGNLKNLAKGETGRFRPTKPTKTANYSNRVTVFGNIAGTRITGAGRVVVGVRGSKDGQNGIFAQLLPYYLGDPAKIHWELYYLQNGSRFVHSNGVLDTGIMYPEMVVQVDAYQTTVRILVNGLIKFTGSNVYITEPGYPLWLMEAYPDPDVTVANIGIRYTDSVILLS